MDITKQLASSEKNLSRLRFMAKQEKDFKRLTRLKASIEQTKKNIEKLKMDLFCAQ